MAGAGGEASPSPTPITTSTITSSTSSSSSMSQAPRSTMEEVWNNLTVSSFNQDIRSTPRLSLQPIPNPSSNYAKASTLQDFLSEPYSQAADTLISIRPPALGLCLGNTDGGEVSALNLRWKRLMKNRESAARSRARKQAYMEELEKEVEKLSWENRELKHKYEELLAAQRPALKRRKRIHRSVSAQF